MIEERLTAAIDERLEAQFAEEWDMNALMMDLQTYYPTRLSMETLEEYEDRDEVIALAVDDALSLYEEKCENYPGGEEMAKEIERDVMLQLLDQRWREHLSDMDYLRDGIHWRQVAQQDPLSAWQKEGYVMFEHLLREVVLPTGLVDVKVAAVGEDWSGLRFVWRKEVRAGLGDHPRA